MTIRKTIFVLALCLLAPAQARAQFFVSTQGDDGNDCLLPATACATIQAAVDRAPDGSEIQVAAGTYAEQVQIANREDLRIQGEPGTVLRLTGLPEGRLINIRLSRSIHLADLTLRGNGTSDFVGGIAISLGQNVVVERSTLEDLGGGGIVLFSDSFASILDSTIRRCRFHGVRVDAGSRATLHGAPRSGGGQTILEDNLFTGVILNGGSASAQGSVVLRGNVVGVLGEGGDFSTSFGDPPLEVLDNVIGISLRGGHLELRGPARIEGNTFAGVRLNGASGSFARFSAERITVGNNGTAGDPATAGVLLTGSHLDLFLADVTGNPSRGVLLQDNSSVRVFDATITENGADGLRIEALSSARIFSPTSIRNNRGFDLSCTPNSFASGDKSEIGRIFCAGFDQSPNPGPPEPQEP